MIFFKIYASLMEIEDIQKVNLKLKFTQHALKEMLDEEFGEITENEIVRH